MDRIYVFDTTLRDGEQSPGASLNTHEKIEIAKQLSRLGVDIIEAGFPISSPGDFEAVKLIAEQIVGPVICGLARTKDLDVDRAAEAIKPARRRRIHTFIATSEIHREKKLRLSKEEIIEMAIKAIRRARNYTDDVEFSPEDASRTDRNYMCDVIEAAIDAGATTINIPDTVGYANPTEFGNRIKYVREKVPNIQKAIISIHCHNDLGLAVANSLAGVINGARQVECTINGIGERAGNASLEEIVMNLKCRPDFYNLETGIRSEQLYRTSRMVSNMTGITVQPNKAIVGANAFAHEAGIHQDGVIKERTTYEIMSATDVGWVGDSMVMGKHSGRHAFKERLEELGCNGLSEEQLNRAFERFKELCDKKKVVYDDDLISIVSEEKVQISETYSLLSVMALSDSERGPLAAVTINHQGEILTGKSSGDGPLDAAYEVIQKLTGIKVGLVSYKIEAVTPGTDSQGAVVVTLQEETTGNKVTGRGSHTDIVIASVKAYLSAINRLVFFNHKKEPAGQI
jgi:2-isopropylmalate synthase